MTFPEKNTESPSRTCAGGAHLEPPPEEICDTSLGRYLYNARADKGITVAALSQKTHIPVTTLQALESDDFEHLPGRIFVVGFIRAYARCLGFNEQEAVRRYDQAQKLTVTPVPSPASLVTQIPLPASPAASAESSSIPKEASSRALTDVIDGVIPLSLSLAALAIAIAVCLSVGTYEGSDSDSAQDPAPAVSAVAATEIAAAGETTPDKKGD